MTTFGPSVDLTPDSQSGQKQSLTVGTGGTTAGYPVKADTNANTVVPTGATSDIVLGIARDTVLVTGKVTVLGDGCIVKVPFTLTAGSKVGLSTTDLCDYSTGTCVGVTLKSATLASIILVKIQY